MLHLLDERIVKKELKVKFVQHKMEAQRLLKCWTKRQEDCVFSP